MSKYDALDARTQLEQVITEDLKAALEKRGFRIVHRGTATSHAPAEVPDIVVSNRQFVLTFEVTKSAGAGQDRELNSIRDHLNQVKAENAQKRCYCVFVSSETSPRMLDGIRDHNRQRASEGKQDLKIMPFCFDALELWTTRLRESEADLYPASEFVRLFDRHTEFIDDLRVRKLLLQTVFPTDVQLANAIEKEETERDQRTLEKLIKDLARMEDYLRQSGIAAGPAAIDTLIYLVFLKLYEEKRERDGDTNRLRSPETFDAFRRNSVAEPVRKAKRAIHELFKQIKQEGQFEKSGMFTEGDSLADSIHDDFVLDNVIPLFSQYTFLGTRLDALGAVYEVLARRAEKDVRVGQFFTPENVVRFMVKLAELEYKDMVLDPACGTGRFLIYSMDDMMGKVDKSTARNKEFEKAQVRLHRLFGADIDPRIAKIAKINMWIHGDGKSNIFGGPDYNGLTLHKHGFNGYDSFDNAFDAVMTNPPLGPLNYQHIQFTDHDHDASAEAQQQIIWQKLDRMPILPRKNLTQERLETVRARLQSFRQEFTEAERQIAEAEKSDLVKEWLRLSEQAKTQEERTRKREIEREEQVRTYKLLCSVAESKRKTIEQNENQAAELDAKLRTGQSDWVITSNTMKGGAMFLAAIWHYLKANSYPDNPPEWRGGKILIILDEGILNTDNYSSVREFRNVSIGMRQLFLEFSVEPPRSNPTLVAVG